MDSFPNWYRSCGAFCPAAEWRTGRGCTGGGASNLGSHWVPTGSYPQGSTGRREPRWRETAKVPEPASAVRA
eukprot:gene16912-biopygen2281